MTLSRKLWWARKLASDGHTRGVIEGLLDAGFQPTPEYGEIMKMSGQAMAKIASVRPVAGSGGGRAINVEDALMRKVIGQEAIVREIAPYVEMHKSGLAPEGRPVGIFLLLGPTGVGKSYTVEALAEVLHGSPKFLLRVDCGEFQMDHEVAKLIGAPPGYLGHRETQPMFTQSKLGAVTSDHSNLAIILFDEIEKASGSVHRLLLGILDKGTLRLGDNTTVNFERTLIFMTSNLGAVELRKLMSPTLGLDAMVPQATPSALKMGNVGSGAAKKRFSPEFMNRVDEVLTYNALTPEAIDKIFEHQIAKLDLHIHERLQDKAFTLLISKAAKEWLVAKGFSVDYGARELKRVILRNITQVLAVRLNRGDIDQGDVVTVDLVDGKLTFETSIDPEAQLFGNGRF